MELSLRARIRAGNPDAFGQLFDEHASAVHRHAVRVTGNWATADDIVSLTFLEAWRLRERVLPDGDSLRPWLLGIATNVLRNTSRAARRHQTALARLPPATPVPDFADEVTQRLADAEELAAAHKALSRLRRGEREVFTLCVWEGLDAASAAEALGVAVGTVRARLSRARKRLRSLTELELDQAARPSGTQRPPANGQIPGSRHQAARSPQEKKR
ncbi:RNA polymerase sigma factor [Streptomyces sp. P17]|uniref:RNA polymerase sigma factor n=1 Tax=Streptomyces sp. P17 TaxID=3074716 RepID=UPI0028F43712|nr:RNA polymerase sigma factor [Streptomyces sp. P17]MDT9698308.1 RNA polymerase sigma factor [Streptomyces sp. P17]